MNLPEANLLFKKTLIFLSKLAIFLFILSFIFLLWTKYIILKEKNIYLTLSLDETEEINPTEFFPLGVDPINKEIIENNLVDLYVRSHLSINVNYSFPQKIFDNLIAQLAKWDLYQNLASANSRILVIYPGERKEEIIKNFGDILRWTKSQKEQFKTLVIETEPLLEEGKFFPGRYVVDLEATPEIVAKLLNERFITEIVNKYPITTAQKIPLKETLIMASLIQREAYDFTDMRYISGIIWNRRFIDMPLQLDASLQYIRGSKKNEPKWWPKVNPADKFLNSPYNTYKNKDLPPTPIANPSVEAIIATLNPKKTDCMFYFHDSKSKFYCSPTYEEHVKSLKKVYGRGK